MHKSLQIQGFTLVEVIVVVTILIILSLGISSIDLRRISNEQQLDIELLKISNQITETRNNALIGRGVGNNLIVPDGWKIELTATGTTTNLRTYYSTGSTYILESNLEWLRADNSYIDSIVCETITGSGSSITPNPLELYFTGSKIGIGNCDDGLGNNYKIVDVIFNHLGNTGAVSFNGITGTISSTD